MRLGWTGVAYIAMRRFIRMITLTMKKTKLNTSRTMGSDAELIASATNVELPPLSYRNSPRDQRSQRATA